MSENSVLSIRNQVIAGLILAALIGLASSIFGWWDRIGGWLGNAFAAIWAFLTITISFPLWALIPVVAVSVFAGLIIVAQITRDSKTDLTPPFLRYIEDNIWRVLWRWDWCKRGEKYEIENLRGYCQTCDGLLVYQNVLEFGEHKCELICEHCQHSVKATFDNKIYGEVQGMVGREITRRIRTNQIPVE